MKSIIHRVIALLLSVAFLCEIAPCRGLADEGDNNEQASDAIVDVQVESIYQEENGIIEYQKPEYIVDNADLAVSEMIDIGAGDNDISEDAKADKMVLPEVLYEDVALREMSAKHFRLGDGSFIAVQYDTAVHYIDEEGEWADIDNTLVLRSETTNEKNEDYFVEDVSLDIVNDITRDLPSEDDSKNYDSNIANELSADNSDSYIAEFSGRKVAFPAQVTDGTLYTISSGDYRVQLSLNDLSTFYQTDQVAASDDPEEEDDGLSEDEMLREININNGIDVLINDDLIIDENEFNNTNIEITSTVNEDQTVTYGSYFDTEDEDIVPNSISMSSVSLMFNSYALESSDEGTEGTDVDDKREIINLNEPFDVLIDDVDGSATLTNEDSNPESEQPLWEDNPIQDYTISFDELQESDEVFIDDAVSANMQTENLVDSVQDVNLTSDNLVDDMTATKKLDTGAAIERALEKAEFFNNAKALIVNTDDMAASSRANGQVDEDAYYSRIYPKTLVSEVTYENIYEGVDIQYVLYGYDVKESVVINKAREEYVFIFTLDLDNLVPQLDQVTGEVFFSNGDTVIYEMPAPYMFDANGAISNAVVYELQETNDGQYMLVVVADADWINDPDRTFPVSIDPTLYDKTQNTNAAITTTYTTSGDPNLKHTNYQLISAGRSQMAVVGELNMFLNVNTLPSIPPNCVITDAQIALAYVGFSYSNQTYVSVMAYRVSDDKPSNYSTYKDWIKNLTHNTMPNRSDEILDYHRLSSSNLYTYISWDVVRAAQDWYLTKDQDANRSIKLEATDLASDRYVYASFNGYGTSTPAYFIVHYQNTVGLENYYTYQTVGVDRAGTAYINDFTQQLTFVHPDVSLSVGDTNYTLSHVYNSAYSGSHFHSGIYSEANGLHTNSFDSMLMGYGWKLSAQETMCSLTISDTTYLVYNDADGTEHYFRYNSSNNKWEDEDGLGLTCTKSTSSGIITYTMQDKDAYTTKVFYNGYLMSVTDSNGNAIYYVYGNGNSYSGTGSAWKPSENNNQLYQIVQITDGASAIVIATLSYDSSNRLSQITDYANRTTTYSYGSGGRLSTITHPDGTMAVFTYEVISESDSHKYMLTARDSESSYMITLSYVSSNVGGRLVRTVIESANGTSGAGFTVVRDGSQLMHYRYYGQDRTPSTSDDIVVYNTFDYWGRSLCSYTRQSHVIQGASAATYSQNSGTDKKNNHITSTADVGIQSANLLLDSGLEFSDSVSAWVDIGNSSISGTTSGISPHLGNKMIALTGSGGTSGRKQVITLTKGKTYTFSGYVKTNNISASDGGGAYLSIMRGNTVYKTSTVINYDTASVIDNGWEKISVTFSPPETNVYALVFGLKNASGAAYGDDFQLEIGETATNTNLLQNAAFEMSDIDTYWTKGQSTSDICVTSTIPPSDTGTTRAMQLTGSANEERSLSQTIPIGQPATNKSFILSGWAYARSTTYPQNDDRDYALYAIFHYSDNTTEEHNIDYSYAVTGWQYGSVAVVPKETTKTITSIEVKLSYKKNCNSAVFDDLSLVMEPAQAYTYDSKGNLISATDKNGKTSYTYQNGTSLLSSYTDLAGITYTLNYDAAHNVTQTASAGVTVTNTYNAAGAVRHTQAIITTPPHPHRSIMSRRPTFTAGHITG